VYHFLWVILGLILNELTHIVTDLDKPFDTVFCGHRHRSRLHTVILSEVNPAVHQSKREVTHIRVSRNGKLLLIGDFINPIIKLWDFAVYPPNCIGQKLGKWYILTGFTDRIKSTKACAFHLYFAQHHIGVFDKVSVHRNTVFVRIKVYPVWLYIYHSVTLLQDKNIARDLRASVCLKGVVWQTDST